VLWPALLLFSIKSSFKSLFSASGRPHAVFVSTHIEAFVYGVLKSTLIKRQPLVILLGFIYTQRKNRIHIYARKVYFNVLFSLIDKIVCHSAGEVASYQSLFAAAKDKFVFVPYGLHIDGYEQYASAASGSGNVGTGFALSAGRSGRDYYTLCQAFNDLNMPLHIICDYDKPLLSCMPGNNIVVFRECHDDCYVQQLKQADMMIVPLAVNDISAGQMVLIQAMAYAKPIIVTRSASIENYLIDGVNSILVPPQNASAISQAVKFLIDNPQIAYQLARNAYQTYLQQFSMEAFIAKLLPLIDSETAAQSQ